MRILYSALCEHASAREDGRLDIHGMFHQLYAPGFPAQQDEMVLVLAIEWNDAESGRHEFSIDLQDPSRSPVLTINGHTDVTPLGQGEPPPQTRLIMPLENVVFPQVGTYLFVLKVAGKEVPLTPLHLMENPDDDQN